MFATKFLSSYFQGSKLCLASSARATDRFTSRYQGIAVDHRWHSSARLPNCKQNKEVSDGSVQSQFSPSTTPRWHLPTWVRWAFGSVVTLPFWREVEVATQVVEEAADAVEKVSVMAEKASEEVAEKLPEDSKLRDTVMLVERMSKEAAAEAHLAKDIIHKVHDLKEEVDALLNPTKVPQKLMDKNKRN